MCFREMAVRDEEIGGVGRDEVRSGWVNPPRKNMMT